MSNKELRRRLGKFHIAVAFLEEAPQVLADVLKFLEFIPLHVEQRYHEMCFRMCGISSKFRFVEHGEKIPFYDVSVTKENGNLIFSVKELDDK